MFITVEGPIGVGKTSLANAISHHFSFSMLREIVEENLDDTDDRTVSVFICTYITRILISDIPADTTVGNVALRTDQCLSEHQDIVLFHIKNMKR